MALEAAHEGADHRAAGARARRKHARYVACVAQVLRDAAASGDVMHGSALGELLRADRHVLDDVTLVGNLAFILKIAHDNTSGIAFFIMSPEFLQP